MTVSYRMKASDHWGLNRYVMTHDLRSGGPLIVAGLLAPLFLLQSMLRDGKSFHEAATAAVMVLLIACVVGYPLFRVLAWAKFRALPVHLQHIEMSLEQAGVRVVTSSARQTVKWSAIARVRQDRQAIYFFLSRRSALIVPLRAFATRGDVATFLDFARQHTGGR